MREQLYLALMNGNWARLQTRLSLAVGQPFFYFWGQSYTQKVTSTCAMKLARSQYEPVPVDSLPRAHNEGLRSFSSDLFLGIEHNPKKSQDFYFLFVLAAAFKNRPLSESRNFHLCVCVRTCVDDS